MVNETDATLQEVLNQVSAMEAVKVLPLCISAVVPFHYTGGATVKVAQQDNGISIMSGSCSTVLEPKPHG